MSKAQAEQLSRLLGLVFAGADLVIEVDARGAITFALGAAEALTGKKENELVGQNWTRLLAGADGEVLTALMYGVSPGERRGPLRLTLAHAGSPGGQKHVSISAFKMPGREDFLSAAISLAPPGGPDFVRTKEGLLANDQFGAATTMVLAQAAQTGAAVRLDLVELTGLKRRADSLAPEESAQLRRQVAAALRADSFGGVGAAEVAPDRFALIRPMSGSSARLSERLGAVAGKGVKQSMAELPLEPGEKGVNARAIRFALDRFIQEGVAAAEAGFKGAIERTVKEADRFKALSKTGDFKLVYQPVVELKDERLHHFEALARFEAGESTHETIRLAEEMDLILDFDIAVARSVAQTLIEKPETSIAANLSANSLTQPRFIEALMKISDDRALRRRLLLEVTETQRLSDLDAASQTIDVLRKAGFLVCLDDFGAGAASLDYLRAINVDFVKIDGRFIRELTEGSREAVLLKHMVRLCEELGVRTVAEVIETRTTAELAKKLGVTLGQGWAFGKPGPEPVYEPPASAAPSRRRGVVETWG